MEYPDDFYRGLSSKDTVTPEGYVTTAAFSFDKYDATRGDNYCELSINWNDNEGSLQTLLLQHKPFKEEKQFKTGCAKLPLNIIQIMFKQFIDDNVFDYERRPILSDPEADIAENPYHGNLLMHKDLNTSIKKNIQHSLATIATSNVILRADS